MDRIALVWDNVYLKIGVSSMLLTVEYCDGVDWTTGACMQSEQFWLWRSGIKNNELKHVKISSITFLIKQQVSKN